jgi:hypothetical protein
VLDRADSFTPLRTTQHLCRLHFGPDATKSIDALFDARMDIVMAARTLIDLSGERVSTEQDGYSREEFFKLRGKIWGGNKDDAVRRSLDEAETRLLTALGPYLK